MSQLEWRIRVMYYLPANPEGHPKVETSNAYLEVVGIIQSLDEVAGYSETSAHGFWRAPDGQVYLDEVRVLAVDYPFSGDERNLNLHIERVKRLIQEVYAEYDCPQLVIYVVSQDIALHR